MADTPAIIKAINDMHKAFDSSLKEVYTEIKGCNSRVNEIETALEVKRALCKEREKRETGQKKLWQPVVRGVSLAGIIALIALAWEKIVALWRLLGQ